jgi:hypothetical protein
MIEFSPFEKLLIAGIFAWPVYAVLVALATFVLVKRPRFSDRWRTAAIACEIAFIPALGIALWAWTAFEFFDPSGGYYDALHRRTLTRAEVVDGVSLPEGAVLHYRYGVPSWVDFNSKASVGGLLVLHGSADFYDGRLHWEFQSDMRVAVSAAGSLRAAGCVFSEVPAPGGEPYLLMQIAQPQQCVQTLNGAL